MSEKMTSYATRLALLTFIASILGLNGVVMNRHLDSPWWSDMKGELALASLWAIGLSFAAFLICWSVGVIAAWARGSQLPVAADKWQLTRWRLLALSLLLATALMTCWILPAEIQRRRALDFEATPQLLRQIYADPRARNRSEVLAAVAANRNTPSDVLLDLAFAEKPDYDRPHRNLIALLEGPPRSIWQLVACHPATPPEGLAHLAEIGSGGVLEAVAFNPETPSATLIRFTGHSNPAILRSLVRNPRIPASSLERLAEHPDAWVRAGVAGHGNTPSSLLVLLATDPSRIVRHRICFESESVSRSVGATAGGSR
jgi:hypothetical protein